MRDIKRGQHASRRAEPDEVRQLARCLHAEPDADWIRCGGLIAVRCWDTPGLQTIAVGRIVYETELLDAAGHVIGAGGDGEAG